MLKNVIWCHTDENGDPVEHLSEFDGLTSLIDLRGFTTFGFQDSFANVWNAENIVFGADVTPVARKTDEVANAKQMFNGASGVARVWCAGQDVPEAGVMDLSRLEITKITTKTFNLSSNKISTVVLPSTLTAVAGKSAKQYTFGNKLYIDYVCDATVQTLIVNFIKTNYSALQAETANISINGTSIADLVK